MWIVSKRRLRDFWRLAGYSDARHPLEAWYKVVSAADWRRWSDVRSTFRTADLVGDCVVFDVGGNNYRLIAGIRYKLHKVFVLKVMMHSEYSRQRWPEECGCFRDPRVVHAAPGVRVRAGRVVRTGRR